MRRSCGGLALFFRRPSRRASCRAFRRSASMPLPESLHGPIRAAESVSVDEALVLLRDWRAARTRGAGRRRSSRLHPEPVVTYIIDRNVNYTNICNASCKFCAFYREVGSPEGYVLDEASLHAEDRRDPGSRRASDPPAGGAQPRARHRILRRALPLHEVHLARALDPRPLSLGSAAHRPRLEASRSTTS